IVGSALQADPPTVVGGHRDPLVVGVLLGPAGQLAVEGGQPGDIRCVQDDRLELSDSHSLILTHGYDKIPPPRPLDPPRAAPADSAGPSTGDLLTLLDGHRPQGTGTDAARRTRPGPRRLGVFGGLGLAGPFNLL